MALAKDETVALRIGWILWIDPEHSKEKRRERICRRQVATDVPCSRSADHFDDASPDLGGDFPQSLLAFAGVDRRRQRIEGRSATGECC
jgi:hypothetical protein